MLFKFKPFLKKTKKSTTAFLGVLLLLVGVVSGLLLISRRQIFVQKAAPNTVLNLVSSGDDFKVGDNFTIFLTIDTGSNTFVGAELYIDIQPASLIEVIDITPGDFLPVGSEEVKSINNVEGKIEYLVYLAPGIQVNPLQGKGTLAVISAKALKSGLVSINFDPRSQTASSDEEAGQNLLLNAEPTQIFIKNNDDLAENTDFPYLTQTKVLDNGVSPTITYGEVTKKVEPTKMKRVFSPTPASFLTPTLFEEPKGKEGDVKCVSFGNLFFILRRLGRDVDPGSEFDFDGDGRIGFDDLFRAVKQINFNCG